MQINKPEESLIGQSFGRWTVVRRAPNKNGGRQYFSCQCSCGTVREVVRYSLLSGNSQSCGCLKLENIKKTLQLPSGVSGLNRVYKRYRTSGAEGRGLPFDLTQEEFATLVEQPCHYCGQIGSITTYGNGNTKSPYVHNGLDRVDNTKGYTKDNVVPCCKICNSMKSSLSYKEFVDKVMAIATKLKGN
jgi:hypothetical protein